MSQPDPVTAQKEEILRRYKAKHPRPKLTKRQLAFMKKLGNEPRKTPKRPKYLRTTDVVAATHIRVGLNRTSGSIKLSQILRHAYVPVPQ